MKIIEIIKEMLNDDAAIGKRGKVLLKFTCAHFRFFFRKSFVFKWINGVKLYAVYHRASSTECYYYDYYDPMEMHFVEKYLKKGDVFADVGANIGSWALFAASCEAYAYAIEPTPSTFELLKMNVELNPRLKDNIEMVNVAIGDKVGELLFAIDSDSENHVVSTEEAGREIIHVSCDTLDNLCEKNLEVAKIDVENFGLPKSSLFNALVNL